MAKPAPGAKAGAEAPSTGGAEAAPAEPAAKENERARVELEAEFHRTRTGPAPRYWVLGEIHNQSEAILDDLRVDVRFLDESGEEVGQVSGQVPRVLGLDERAAFAVLVETPPAHEEIELAASGLAHEGPAPAIPRLILEYEEPTRADLGGWYVIGRVRNPGEAETAAARLEIRGLDGEDRLLGLDWYELDRVEAGGELGFEIAGLRYDEAPERFELALRPSAP